MCAKREFEVKIRKQDVVAAARPIQEHRLPQSNLDLLLPRMEVGVFFCYKNSPTASGYTNFESKVNVLKKALSRTLVSYYVFAGEMMQKVGGEPDELLCNNRGVDFLDAFADIELRELDLYNPDESLEGKLIPTKKQGVLAVQATELKCGGLIIGCKFDHRVADAYSANRFFESWAAVAQGRPISMEPSFQRSLLFPRSPGSYDFSVTDMYVATSEVPLQESNNGPHQASVSHIYYVKAENIRQLQSLANENCEIKSSGEKITKLEAFSAFLWKTFASATHESDGKNCTLGIVVDGRTRLEANLMNAYFGNVISAPFAEKTNKQLKGMQLNQVADSVHKLLKKTATKDHFLGLIDYVEAHRPEQTLMKFRFARVSKQEPAFVVSSGQRFPVGKIDFGFGRPIFGSYCFPWGLQIGYIMPMPSAAGNGDWIFYMHLLKEHMEAVETHASHVFEPMSLDYLF